MKNVKRIIVLAIIVITMIGLTLFALNAIKQQNEQLDEYEEYQKAKEKDYSIYTGGAENDSKFNNTPGNISWDGIPLSSMYTETKEFAQYYHVSEIIPTDSALEQGAIITIQDNGQEFVKHVFLNNDNKFETKLVDPKTGSNYVAIEKYADKKAGTFFIGYFTEDSTCFIKQMVYGQSISQYYDIKDAQSVYDLTGTTLYTVPETVTGEYVIQNNTEQIGNEAFMFCKELTSVNIPSSVQTIGQAAFLYCINLESVVVPEGVTTIESKTFYGCENMQYIELPSTITSIKENAFFECNATIYYAGTEEQWEAIDIQKQGWNDKAGQGPKIIFNYNAQSAT